MPKIHSADCYTKPPIKELAARERAEPGFCACVKDFAVQQHCMQKISAFICIILK
ncbi:unnamed protein product [Coffea canephora]|uniref:Uncharacterized protein n=1 Tax=Coffea canephora TaxID=49390 RepID=A0A068V3S9_COFCA|nr:unnamed protein product [Coffea canephora]